MFDVKLVITRWEGPRVKGRVQEANKRLVGSIAYDGQNAAKRMAHVRTGRMQGATTVRNIHSAFAVARNADPEDYGKDREGAIREVASFGEQASVDMGSFVPYSFIEEVLRGHRFVQPGMDEARSNIPERVRQVGEEMGLR